MKTKQKTMHPLILYDDLIDVGDRREFLLPGDLVELRYFKASRFPYVDHGC